LPPLKLFYKVELAFGGVFEPGMGQQLFGRVPLLWLFLKTHVYEFAKARRPPFRIDFWRLILCDIKKDPSLLFVNVGRLALRKFYHKDAERPHVYFVIVSLLSTNHFRRHPTHCADLTLTSCGFFGQLNSVSKVCQFDRTLRRD
jgi:hypothetical protein